MFVCVDSTADESWKVDYTGFPSQIFILRATSSIAGRRLFRCWNLRLKEVLKMIGEGARHIADMSSYQFCGKLAFDHDIRSNPELYLRKYIMISFMRARLLHASPEDPSHISRGWKRTLAVPITSPFLISNLRSIARDDGTASARVAISARASTQSLANIARAFRPFSTVFPACAPSTFLLFLTFSRGLRSIAEIGILARLLHEEDQRGSIRSINAFHNVLMRECGIVAGKGVHFPGQV